MILIIEPPQEYQARQEISRCIRRFSPFNTLMLFLFCQEFERGCCYSYRYYQDYYKTLKGIHALTNGSVSFACFYERVRPAPVYYHYQEKTFDRTCLHSQISTYHNVRQEELNRINHWLFEPSSTKNILIIKKRELGYLRLELTMIQDRCKRIMLLLIDFARVINV